MEIVQEQNGRAVQHEQIEEINKKIKEFVKYDEFINLEKKVDQ